MFCLWVVQGFLLVGVLKSSFEGVKGFILVLNTTTVWNAASLGNNSYKNECTYLLRVDIPERQQIPREGCRYTIKTLESGSSLN